jgi:hypothetical protein
VSRPTQDTRQPFRFRIRDFHPLWSDFPDRSAIYLSDYASPTTPKCTNHMVWAFPRSLAATSGISIDFFSFGYLDVSVPRVRFHAYVFSTRILDITLAGLPHSEIPGSKPVTAPRGLSQPSTSFIASYCQGIHRMPLVALS